MFILLYSCITDWLITCCMLLTVEMKYFPFPCLVTEKNEAKTHLSKVLLNLKI